MSIQVDGCGIAERNRFFPVSYDVMIAATIRNERHTFPKLPHVDNMALIFWEKVIKCMGRQGFLSNIISVLSVNITCKYMMLGVCRVCESNFK